MAILSHLICRESGRSETTFCQSVAVLRGGMPGERVRERERESMRQHMIVMK